MSVRYAVKNVVFESGERFAFLVDRRTGLPEFDVTVFTLVEFRQRDRASATIEQVLRSIKVFVLFCDLQEIVLEERLRDGRLLEMGEVDALAQLCRLPLDLIESRAEEGLVDSSASRKLIASLETYRARSKAPNREVAGDSAGVRVRYIRQYLKWRVDRHLLSLSTRHPTHAALSLAKDVVIPALDARVAAAKGRNSANARTGLSEEAQTRLWEVIEPDSQQNPWTGRHTKVRNALIVRWFMGLGVRRGELLGVKLSDVDLRKNEVFIARRPDDKVDPRAHQPNTKTHDRQLVLSDDLARRTQAYIIEVRREIAGARKHPFLFVANGGQPLSLRGLNKIFSVLRQRCPDLPEEVFPHAIRHTWNDNFSKTMDEQGETSEHEKKMRSRLMGWNPSSETADTYNKRHIERKSKKASIELQQKMVIPSDES
ncbi:tyrosine-type recombinase/integrase [Paraburkholderia panacisoli]|uniref:Tyrosine-type recombinase/integrase n=1 Tax=Paraburkholderia panacisoli TaxID=2603818 RepID=A0A5B0HIG2_9BURK|nr:site-specific integrase [Paraburkholderia panacisoli]KAA1014930.1 tyrosine-type recombinase/integrase [Paraburkholderia panacisoli]